MLTVGVWVKGGQRVVGVNGKILACILVNGPNRAVRREKATDMGLLIGLTDNLNALDQAAYRLGLTLTMALRSPDGVGVKAFGLTGCQHVHTL